VAVEVQCPGVLDEWEASWYRERLADPSLLDSSVVIVIDRVRYLAVPVGGQRRAGYIPVEDRDHLWRLRDALKDRPGFPSLRLRWSTHAYVSHAVAWGDPVPRDAGDRETQEFYGFDAERFDRANADELGDSTAGAAVDS